MIMGPFSRKKKTTTFSASFVELKQLPAWANYSSISFSFSFCLSVAAIKLFFQLTNVLLVMQPKGAKIGIQQVPGYGDAKGN